MKENCEKQIKKNLEQKKYSRQKQISYKQKQKGYDNSFNR